jgi:tungstate transport system substrate-binding protein
MNTLRTWCLMGLAWFFILVGACESKRALENPPEAGQSTLPASPPKPIILATTTSTEDSGLLRALLPDFTRATGIEVKTVAVGSGQAMELGKRGEADVLLVHSPLAEEEFVSSGAGKDRRPVMHNDFVLLGPAQDPAGIKGEATAAAAVVKIVERGAIFVSRGDRSGTHTKELSLWTAAGVRPGAEKYLETGGGMGETLRIASEKKAYTLSDRATFLATSGLELVVLGEGDPILLNPYHVISVVGPKVNTQGAKAFADFLTSEKGRMLIRGFRCPKSGQPLFVPTPLGEDK